MVEPGGKLTKLIGLFIALAHRKAWAKIEVTVQAGQIKLVHVGQSFSPENLPVTMTDDVNLGIGEDAEAARALLKL